jgi:hypothetical protein
MSTGYESPYRRPGPPVYTVPLRGEIGLRGAHRRASPSVGVVRQSGGTRRGGSSTRPGSAAGGGELSRIGRRLSSGAPSRTPAAVSLSATTPRTSPSPSSSRLLRLDPATPGYQEPALISSTASPRSLVPRHFASQVEAARSTSTAVEQVTTCVYQYPHIQQRWTVYSLIGRSVSF